MRVAVLVLAVSVSLTEGMYVIDFFSVMADGTYTTPQRKMITRLDF